MVPRSSAVTMRDVPTKSREEEYVLNTVQRSEYVEIIP